MLNQFADLLIKVFAAIFCLFIFGGAIYHFFRESTTFGFNQLDKFLDGAFGGQGQGQAGTSSQPGAGRGGQGGMPCAPGGQPAGRAAMPFGGGSPAHPPQQPQPQPQPTQRQPARWQTSADEMQSPVGVQPNARPAASASQQPGRAQQHTWGRAARQAADAPDAQPIPQASQAVPWSSAPSFGAAATPAPAQPPVQITNNNNFYPPANQPQPGQQQDTPPAQQPEQLVAATPPDTEARPAVEPLADGAVIEPGGDMDLADVPDALDIPDVADVPDLVEDGNMDWEEVEDDT